MRVRTLLLMASVLLCGCLLGGCTVVHRVGPSPTVRVSSYRPPSYLGQVVYFTSSGAPYVWVNGRRVYVPASERRHYTTHYANHRDSYVVWSRSNGHPGHDQPRASSSHPRTGRHGTTSSGGSGGNHHKRDDDKRDRDGSGNSKKR